MTIGFRLNTLELLYLGDVLPCIPDTAYSVAEIILSIRSWEMAGMEDRWLSVEEIGKYLGISNDTVYRWIDKHAMPAHRMGRLWKFKKEDVDQWVKAGGAAGHSKRISDKQ